MNFYAGGGGLRDERSHFLRRVGLANRSRGIMASEAAAIKRQGSIDERQVQRMPDQVVDQDGNPAHAQGFIDELHHLLWIQMVCEQVAAHEVETCIPEGKREGIAHHRTVSVPPVFGPPFSFLRCDAARSSRVTSRRNPWPCSHWLATSGTYPEPAATSSRESEDEFSFRATRRTISWVVATPPNKRLIWRRSESEAATSAGVPESESSSSGVATRFIERRSSVVSHQSSARTAAGDDEIVH